MDRKRKAYFELGLNSLRVLAAWAADCAERALGIFEDAQAGDSRPRAAILEARAFAEGGKRSAKLRRVAVAAFAAARETRDPAAAAAAQSAGLAAAAAYTHPLVDVQQTKHVVGPAAYAALAMESRQGGGPEDGAAELRRALGSARSEIREILSRMPKRSEGKSRIERLMFDLDAGIRGN